MHYDYSTTLFGFVLVVIIVLHDFRWVVFAFWLEKWFLVIAFSVCFGSTWTSYYFIVVFSELIRGIVGVFGAIHTLLK